MITSLCLENFKSHSVSELRFTGGTNILVGRMGSGKSSVLDALCFALYGTFPKMSRRDQKVENLVNIASEGKFAKIILEFEKSGKAYSVTRKIGKKLSEAEIRENGKLVQKGPKPVTQHITSILGVDYELFTRAIYSEQNRIDYLLSLNPRQRKVEIDWLLGLGKFDKAREAAQEAARKLSEKAGGLFSDADNEKSLNLNEKIKEHEEHLGEKEKHHKKLEQNKEKMLEKLKQLSSDLAALEKLKTRWENEKTECDLQKGAIQRLKAETEKKQKPGKKELDLLCLGCEKAEKGLKGAKEKSKKAQSEVSSLKSEVAVLESQEKAAKFAQNQEKELNEKLGKLTSGKKITELEKEKDALKSEQEKLSAELSLLQAQRKELEMAAKNLLSAKAKCPVCDSDLTGGRAQKLANEKEKQMKNRQELAKKAAKLAAQKKSEISRLEHDIAEAKSLFSGIERLQEQKASPESIREKAGKKREGLFAIEKQGEKTEKELDRWQNELDKAKESLDEAKRAEKLFADLETAQKKLSDSEQKLAKIEFDEKKYNSLRNDTEQAKVGHAKAESEAKGELEQLKLMHELLQGAQKELAELEKKQKKAKRYSQASQAMAIYKNSLIASQSELRSTLVEEINQALAEIWPAVYPYSDYSGVKLEADEKDYKLLMQKQGWKEVDAVASGGERACLCLALRIAFATVLTPDIGWLILDEPTHNLDSDAVATLSEAINSKIPSIVEQIFVITHDPALGEIRKGAVFRLERDKATGQSTRVETG